jgi:ribonuclease P/MRP protein subunit RPP1
MKGKILIQENDFERARKLIKENKGKVIIFSSDDDEVNRKILEKEDIEILLLNQSGRKDFSKQRNSGFNHVMAKIAKKKGVIIGMNLDEIINSGEKEKAAIIARIKQNIKICNKNGLKMKFVYKNQKRNILDLRALGLVLGMPTSMVKDL